VILEEAKKYSKPLPEKYPQLQPITPKKPPLPKGSFLLEMVIFLVF